MSEEPAAQIPDVSESATPLATERSGEPAAPLTVVEGPEPSETPLLKKLSAQDKTAIKALRSKLPDVFASAYDVSKKTSTTLWGVTLDPAAPPSAREYIVLHKFLKARNMDVGAAQEMLTATLRWRDEIDVDAVMKEEFPEEVFGTLGRIAGHDLDGRPVTYNLYGEITDSQAVFGDVKRFIRWRVQLMEKGVALLDFENIDQMVQVHDYSGVSMSSRTPESKAAASEASSVFGSHYPELLSRKFMVGVPTLMSWIFWVFKAIVPSQTFAKMTLVGTGSETIGKELEKVISKKELPKRYGGEGEEF